MSFNLETWKQKIKEGLTGWKTKIDSSPAATVYSVVAASTLWPLFEAVNAVGLQGLPAAAGALLAGIGGTKLPVMRKPPSA